MKIHYVLLLVALAALANVAQGYNSYSHTYYSDHVPFQTGSPEKESLWHSHLFWDRDLCVNGWLQVVPFGGESIGHELATYFAPHGSHEYLVEEYKTADANSTKDLNKNKNLEARHFNIETDQSYPHAFRSKLTFEPHHTFFGIGLDYVQSFWEKYWFEISAPIMKVTNWFDIKETIEEQGGGVAKGPDGQPLIGLDGRPRYDNMMDYFNKSNLNYGRIIPGKKLEKWGVADIELKLGWITYNNGEAHLRSFVGLTIPTGNKPEGRYLFEPVVGNNQHFGLIFGSNFCFPIIEHGKHHIRQEIDTCGHYLFANHQMRSFDLVGKNWSRYMEIYTSLDQATGAGANGGSFGIETFTRRVEVDPRFSFTFNTAIDYTYSDWLVAEFGYNMFARQGEKIELDKDFPDGIALKHVNGNGLTTRSRTINSNFAGDSISLADYLVDPININDISLKSAAHPPLFSQTFYGSVGYQINSCHVPTLISVGGSYEWSRNNAGMHRFSVWGKLGMAF
jgi:hypothetical protein